MIKNTLLLVLLAISSFAQKTWKPTTAGVSFKIKHAAGAMASGSFKGFAGSINFDKENLNTAIIKASIDASTIDTDNSVRDKVIKGEDYFDVQKYPKISMTSTKIEKGKNANEYIGTFNLTIKNTTKTISFPFSFIEENGKGVFKGSFSINRIDYGVGGKSFLLANTATVSILLNVSN